MLIKPLSEISAKFVRRASVAGEDYKTGVGRVTNWQTNTLSSEALYNAGVEAAITAGRFGKGVTKVTNDAWKTKAQVKGGANYGSGVRLAELDFSAGYAPYRTVVEGLTLPPRGPKGSPENYERVRLVGEAQHNAKLAT